MSFRKSKFNKGSFFVLQLAILILFLPILVNAAVVQQGFNPANNYDVTGRFDVGGGKFKPPTGTVATMLALPSPEEGDLFTVQDGTSTTDCATGGGTILVFCQYDSGVPSWVAKQGISTAGDTMNISSVNQTYQQTVVSFWKTHETASSLITWPTLLAITNPGFETCSGGDATGWTRDDTNNVLCNTVSPRTGTYAMTSKRIHYAYQTAALTGGVNYTFQVYAKTTSSSQTASMRIATAAGGGGTQRCISSTTALNYTLLSCAYQPGSNETVYINLRSLVNNTNTAYFDDVAVATSVTGMTIGTTTLAANASIWTKTNLDRENTVKININNAIKQSTSTTAMRLAYVVSNPEIGESGEIVSPSEKLHVIMYDNGANKTWEISYFDTTGTQYYWNNSNGWTTTATRCSATGNGWAASTEYHIQVQRDSGQNYIIKIMNSSDVELDSVNGSDCSPGSGTGGPVATTSVLQGTSSDWTVIGDVNASDAMQFDIKQIDYTGEIVTGTFSETFAGADPGVGTNHTSFSQFTWNQIRAGYYFNTDVTNFLKDNSGVHEQNTVWLLDYTALSNGYAASTDPSKLSVVFPMQFRTRKNHIGNLAGVYSNSANYGQGDSDAFVGDLFQYYGADRAPTSQSQDPGFGAMFEATVNDGQYASSVTIDVEPAANETRFSFNEGLATFKGRLGVGRPIINITTGCTTYTNVLSVSPNGTTVTSSSTTFPSTAASYFISFDGDNYTTVGGQASTRIWYDISSYTDSTHVVLVRAYDGASKSGASGLLCQGSYVADLDIDNGFMVVESNTWNWALNDVLSQPPSNQVYLYGVKISIDRGVPNTQTFSGLVDTSGKIMMDMGYTVNSLVNSPGTVIGGGYQINSQSNQTWRVGYIIGGAGSVDYGFGSSIPCNVACFQSPLGGVTRFDGDTGNVFIKAPSANNLMIGNGSATPGAGTGTVAIGNDNSDADVPFTGAFQIASNAANPLVSFWKGSSDAPGAQIRLYKARTSVTAPTVVANNDNHAILSYFYDGSAYLNGTSINMAVDGTPGANDMPTRISFNVMADGGSTSIEALRIDNKRHFEYTGTAPTAAGCGTSPTIVGNDNAGSITIGATPGTCVVTFGFAWTNAPLCTTNNQTSVQLARATSVGTTSFTISGTIAQNDVISWQCMGRR